MDISGLTLILLSVVLVVLVWVGWQLRARSRSDRPDRLETAVELLKADLISRQSESLLQLRQSIDSANQLINERLAEGTSSLDRRMAVLGEIENRLGQLATKADNIEEVGKNIQSLSELLRPPKLRGSVGEMMLENLLGQIVPAAIFETQYKFSDGSRVDAVVRLADRLLPIDAKFPLEAYERLRQDPESSEHQKAFTNGFKKHVDDIAKKYLKPGEKTTDFAVMYVPAEAVYYRLISAPEEEAFRYALSQRVIPSSPGHLYAFLASVVTMYGELALLGDGAGAESRRLMAGLNDLAETAERLARFHSRIEGSLRALTAGFDRARTELEKARGQVEKLRAPQMDTAEEPIIDEEGRG